MTIEEMVNEKISQLRLIEVFADNMVFFGGDTKDVKEINLERYQLQRLLYELDRCTKTIESTMHDLQVLKEERQKG